MNIMTFNIRYAEAADGRYAWPHRRQPLADQILAWGPDIIGLQEVMAGQRADLEKVLGGHYQSVGSGRDWDGGGEQCPVYFRRGSFELVEATLFWLSDTPTEAGSRQWKELSYTPALPRICTCVRLRGAQTAVTIFNTHWDHQWPQVRLLSARLVRARMAEARARGERVVMMGDLNATEDEPGIAHLSQGFVNCYRRIKPAGAAPLTYHGYAGLKAADGCHIDYIFTDPELAVTDCQILTEAGPNFLSDHFAVRAELDGLSS